MEEAPSISRPPQRNSYCPDRGISRFGERVGTNSAYVWANDGLGESKTEELSKKLKFLSRFPHFTAVNGKNAPLTPALLDPGIYAGPENYKIAPKLQDDCLKDVMKKADFRQIRVALVDLTKGRMRPEFAGSWDHKKQVFVASVAKIAAMLAAFQLRHDLRFARRMKGGNKTLDELFASVRDDWAAAHRDPGKLVLRKGDKIDLKDPKSPQLENSFGPRWPLAIDFNRTGEDEAQLWTIADELLLTKEYEALKKAKEEWTVSKGAAAWKKLEEANRELEKAKLTKQPEGRKKFDALGFWERLGITVAGRSDYAASTIVRDLGFPYIASTLLQSGVYDPRRGGGLWLGADYGRIVWEGALAGGDAVSATAGSLAAFMTLLVQKRLVSPEASAEMQFLMEKAPSMHFPGYGSWFANGLVKHLGQLAALKRVLSKVGQARNGSDECAYIEREVNDGKGGKKLLCYVAVGLRAKVGGSTLEQLIIELDKCILANNNLKPEHGGHPKQ
jgi:hypothetical protein